MNTTSQIKQPIQKGVAKVPVVMQMEALECGAASLAMVAAYYDKWIPLEQVRVDCGVSRDGSNAANILAAARSYGFTAKGYRMEVEALRELGTFPCIIHWNFNHFVVLDGFEGDKAYINDPANGSYAVSMETFDESYTGICLTFAPGDEFASSGRKKSVIEFARNRLKGAGVAVAFVVLTTIISSLLGVISPAFYRIFMDRLLTGRSPEWFQPFMIGLAILTGLEILVSALETYYSNRIHGKLATVGSTTFLWKVLHLPMEFFSQRYAGDIQERHDSNATIASSVVNTVAPLALNVIMMVFYLVVMIRYSPLLAFLGVLSVLLNMLLSRIISNRRINISRVQMRDAGKFASTTVAGIDMIETIKSSGAENGYFERWAGYQARVNAQNVKFEQLNQYLGMLPEVVNTFFTSLIMFLSVYYAMNGNFTIGMISAFQGILTSFSEPALTLVSAGQTIQEMRTQMERVEDVMQYPDDVVFHNNETPDSYAKLKGAVELRNVSFGYSRLAAPIIKDFSMKVRPGGKVALVGASGCGKSTIAGLVSRLYEPWEGEILFDGRPASEINRAVFTGSLAVVNQEITLFEDTIANNIKMWDESIEDYEMILASRDASMHAEIMGRDGGYHHKVLEGGKNFSGGQRQRLEIARVLAQDPSIIILDEATSALDARTEHDVIHDITERGITCIIVAHRLSTIRDCDEIIVLDHGEVLERGTHDELYRAGGRYTELISND